MNEQSFELGLIKRAKTYGLSDKQANDFLEALKSLGGSASNAINSIKNSDWVQNFPQRMNEYGKMSGLGSSIGAVGGGLLGAGLGAGTGYLLSDDDKKGRNAWMGAALGGLGGAGLGSYYTGKNMGEFIGGHEAGMGAKSIADATTQPKPLAPAHEQLKEFFGKQQAQGKIIPNPEASVPATGVPLQSATNTVKPSLTGESWLNDTIGISKKPNLPTFQNSNPKVNFDSVANNAQPRAMASVQNDASGAGIADTLRSSISAKATGGLGSGTTNEPKYKGEFYSGGNPYENRGDGLGVPLKRENFVGAPVWEDFVAQKSRETGLPPGIMGVLNSADPVKSLANIPKGPGPYRVGPDSLSMQAYTNPGSQGAIDEVRRALHGAEESPPNDAVNRLMFQYANKLPQDYRDPIPSLLKKAPLPSREIGALERLRNLFIESPDYNGVVFDRGQR